MAELQRPLIDAHREPGGANVDRLLPPRKDSAIPFLLPHVRFPGSKEGTTAGRCPATFSEGPVFQFHLDLT